MDEVKVTPGGPKELSRSAVERILERASTIDRDSADSLSVAQFREAALEAGMSEEAVEEALAEYFATDDELDSPPLTVGGKQLARDAGFGITGGAIAALVTLGPDGLTNLGLLGIVLTTIVILVRMGRHGRLERLLQETLAFWAVLAGVWFAALGFHPGIAILAPLGVGGTALAGWILSSIMGVPAHLPEGLDEERRMIPTPVPESD